MPRFFRFMRETAWAVTLLVPVFGVTGFGSVVEADVVRVMVSVQPEAYFVERVGGEEVAVSVLVGPGQSPATYEPTPRQMIELQQTELFFSIGVPFEAGLLPKVRDMHTELNIVDMRCDLEGFTSSTQKVGEQADHGHGHHHGNEDPHVWLDPSKVKVMARTICEHLTRLRPEHTACFERNLQEFITDLAGLNEGVGKRLAAVSRRYFYVFHPAYGHFAKAYGLHQVAVEVDGKEPGPAQLAELIGRARADNVAAIIVQPQFAHQSAKTIADAVGAEIVSLDPLARDYMSNMEHIAETLATLLEKQKEMR